MSKKRKHIKIPRRNKKFDAVLLILFPIIGAVVVDVFRLNYLFSTLIFFGIPSIFLSFRSPSTIKKSLIFTIILSIPLLIILDYPAYLDKSWYVPNSAFRFLNNGIPIEDVPWTLLWVYFAIMFYEYFLEAHKLKHLFSPHIKYLYILLSSLLVGFFLFYFFKPDLLNQPYFYLKLGIAFIVIPLVSVLLKFHDLVHKTIIAGMYFFMVSFLAELVGLRGNHWYFAGQHYFGMTTLLGHPIPYEEIIFWWALGVPGIVCWYEYFADETA